MATKRGGKGKGPGAWQTSSAYWNAIAAMIEARMNAKLTQRDLAIRLGKQPSWVAKIEGRERRLDLIEFIAIARALGLKEDDLLRRIANGLPKTLEI